MESDCAIVAAVDLESRLAARVLKEASRASQAATALHIVGVIEPEARLLRREHGNSEELRNHLQNLRALVEEGLLQLPTACQLYLHVRWGDPAESIVHVAAEANAQLIVVGASGPDTTIRGTVAERVGQWAGCPFLVVREIDWEAKEAGLVPHLTVCDDCVKARENRRHPHWFCDTHDDSTLRVVSVEKRG